MKKITSVFVIMLFMPFVANAQIASKQYVDERDNIIMVGSANADAETIAAAVTTLENGGGIIGLAEFVNDVDSDITDILDHLDGKMDAMTVDATPTENSTNLVTSGGVYDAVESAKNTAVGMKQTSNSFLVTDSNGNVSTANGGFITNDKISSSAAIEMGKIALPTPPQNCDTYGCILMRYNGKYVWELVSRDTNETISDAGGVNASPTSTTTYTNIANPASCQMSGGVWDGTSCEVIK